MVVPDHLAYLHSLMESVTSSHPINPNTIKLIINDGSAKIAKSEISQNANPANKSPIKASPAINPAAINIPLFSTRDFCASLNFLFALYSFYNTFNHTANKNCKCSSERKIHSNTNKHWTFYIHHNKTNTHQHSNKN